MMLDMQTAEKLGRKDHCLGGNSVSHHQMNFAIEILGCEPAILIGQDLAYTKPALNSHFGDQPDGWPEEIKASDKALQDELYVPCTGKGDFYPECHIQQCAMVGGVAPIGPTLVKSSPPYRDFASLFSILIAKHGKKVYNACPNGQKIEGAEYLNLATYQP